MLLIAAVIAVFFIFLAGFVLLLILGIAAVRKIT